MTTHIKTPVLSNMFSVIFDPNLIDLAQQLISLKMDMVGKTIKIQLELPVDSENFLLQLQSLLSHTSFNMIIVSNQRTPIFEVGHIKVISSNMEFNYAINHPVVILLDCSYGDIRRPSDIQY
jgi:hypothetical protein